MYLNFRSWVLAYPVESLSNEMGKEHIEDSVLHELSECVYFHDFSKQ